MNLWGLLVCNTVKKIIFKQAYSHLYTIKFQVWPAYQLHYSRALEVQIGVEVLHNLTSEIWTSECP